MATKKIPELTNVTSVKDTDLLIVETSEGTRSINKGNIVPNGVNHCKSYSVTSPLSANQGRYIYNLLKCVLPAGLYRDNGTMVDWDTLINLEYITVSGSILFTVPDASLIEGTLVISSDVTSIRSDLFMNCNNLTSVIIKDGVTTLNGNAFRSCENLVSVDLPSTITQIYHNVFAYNNSLKSITIPASVTSIGEGVCRNCVGLETAIMLNGVTSISNYMFYNCSSLKFVEIPNSITTIGGSSFNGCTSLESIVIPEGVTEIKSYAFDGCTSLDSIVIPNSVTTIGGNTFRGCNPSVVYYVGDEAAWNAISWDDGNDGVKLNANIQYNYVG